ncbi:hypothetical protein PENTCL1PPCAC_30613 [Pristionchus entomophagus]|uniref:GCF C-terminal domain-containing protein n=1 Tax=Pristionchus entomophagus TaxID=358040 RepID=A0AAV5URK2_9BILA|nr:hypothetical protein PENTCL1PPCAC_30613 [Pristionchus entomophagus]
MPRLKWPYRTIDDVMADEGSIGMRAAKHSGEKVIDMTGPEQRVYTGYEALSMKSLRDVADDQRKFDIPELSHNLNLIIDLTEEDIRKSSHRARNLENSTTALRYDLKMARDELEKEEEDLERMRRVYQLLNSLQDPSTSMDDFKAAFRRLRSEFTAEYTLLELEKVAVPCILPQIKDLFSKWQPLQRDQVAVHLDLMEEWKEILEPPAQANSLFRANTSRGGGGLVDDKLAAFDRLMWDGWMPPVRQAILKWDPRDDMENMMVVVETWLPVMPPWMRDKFIEQLLVPRITTRVEEWDPLTDPKPIHQWLVPWKEVVGDRLLPVFAPIRQKLAKALKKWTSTDNSALLILSPWRDVWTPATMSTFVQHNIVPKLREGLLQMNLDPSRNALYKEFTACISWMVPEGLISPDVIANLLVETFFPRWYETLCFWMDSPAVVKGEVQTWLKEWNARFPPLLLAFPSVKECLRRGLMAFGGVRPHGPAPTASNGTPSLAPAPPPPPPPPSRGAPETQLSVKDVLEMMAGRQNITHIPQQEEPRMENRSTGSERSRSSWIVDWST